MGMRMTFWVVPRASLDELTRLTLRDAARRAGCPLVTHHGHEDEPLLCAEGTDLALFEDDARGRSLAELPDATVGALMAAYAYDAKELIRALAGRPWPPIREAQRGYKRWWVGSLATTVARHAMHEPFRDELQHLARLSRVVGSGPPWFDDLAKEVGARDATSGPLLRVPNLDDLTFVEIEPTRLARLLAWAERVEHFDAPESTPDGGTIASREWDDYVRRHVDLLRAVREDEVLLVAMP